MERRPQVTAWLTREAHPALDAPLQARVDYAFVLAAFVATELEPTKDELRRLQTLCRSISLPPQVADKVLEEKGEPPERLRERLYRLGASPLRLHILRDMVLLGYRDGRYGPADRRKLRNLAVLMTVGEDDVRRIEDEVAEDLHGDDETASQAAEDAPGAWAGVLRVYRRLLGTLSDD